MRRALGSWWWVAFLLLIWGCAGATSVSTTPPQSLRISPSTASVRIGESLDFTAFAVGGEGVTIEWSASAGTITSGGRYTAPTTPGNYTVRAQFAGAPGINATANVAVTDGVTVRITPGAGPVMAPQSRFTFSADVQNTTNRRVSWEATGGTIDQDGLFRPAGVGAYTVTARSEADNSKLATVNGVIVANPRVRMNFGTRGEIVMSLDTSAAPNTVANFVDLVNQQFYNGIILHRYEVGFVIQGGDPLTKTLPLTDPRIGTGGPGYTIPFEASPLRHNQYAVAMALNSVRSDTAGSQFYITLEPEPGLDNDYCVFGNVTSGQAVVDALRRGDTIVSAVTEAP